MIQETAKKPLARSPLLRAQAFASIPARGGLKCMANKWVTAGATKA